MLSVRSHSKPQRLLFFVMALFWIAPFASGQKEQKEKPAPNIRSWSGILVSSSCNADEAFNESPECGNNVPGAKLALYDDTSRVMYSLEPQKSVAAHLGDTVTVRGTVDDDVIQVMSVEPMSIGLATGKTAPAFSIRDQLGRVQTLDTLKGRSGTVLLFFRSADW